MRAINRSVLVLKAKQPMADWLANLLDRSEMEIKKPITVNDINSDSSAYLLPDWEIPEELDAILRDIRMEIFEEVLLGWMTDPDVWPRNRTRELFDQWFDLEIHSMVFDVFDGDPLTHEEL